MPSDLTFNTPDVRYSGTSKTQKTAGENLSQGDAVYAFNTTHYKKAANNSNTTRDCVGVALTLSYTGQPVVVGGPTGNLTLTAGNVTLGETYVLSNATGKIMPIANLTTGMNITYIGYGSSNATIELDISSTGIQKQ